MRRKKVTDPDREIKRRKYFNRKKFFSKIFNKKMDDEEKDKLKKYQDEAVCYVARFDEFDKEVEKNVREFIKKVFIKK
jgi:hypothetical protein